ncbi:MAG: hypothetical protein A2Y07_08215 [Planctomycetes bacterium GWF2_50_10]|nr:MAG: hypothetical protein A2Y07_08215 [Planctomycetes bacterium GWF2_50_10]
MAGFEYQVRSGNSAAALLKKPGQGISTGQAAQTAGNALAKLQGFRFEFGPGRKDVLNFSNQLAVMIKAGISIHDALEAIAEQVENRKFKEIITTIKADIEGGKSFSQSLARYPDVFSNLYVNMMAAAEVSGSLASMLEQLAAYLDQEAETRSMMRGAMVYPAIIAFMAVSVTIFLLTFVLPRFVSIFAGKETLLPAPTKIIMAASSCLRGYWYYMVPALGAAAWGFFFAISTPTGRYWWDRAKLSIPIVSKLCRSLYITRSLHTMGVLSSAGVPILDTLAITAEISGNAVYKNMWYAVHGCVRQGQKIATSLSAHSRMPTSVVQMIRSGEDSGKLSDVLHDISAYYARELRATIKTVTAMIEPIMIILMGFLVGFIAMSIILPIFKMSSLVMGKH